MSINNQQTDKELWESVRKPKANMWRLIQRSSLRAFVFLTLILEMFVFMVQEVMNINKWQLVISFHSDEL